MDARLRARLAEIAGDKFVDGETVSPSTAEQVEQVCLACKEAGTRIAVSSAPAKDGKAPDGAVLVSLSGIDPVDVDHDRLVVRAGAGATLGAVRQAAEKVGLTITGATPSKAADDTRVGEVIAEGRLSRRALSGVEAVLPGGGRVQAGGAVLKDVTGYDLIGALLGSRGRLALITAATFRLQPQGLPAADQAEPAGVPRAVLGDALEQAFDPQRLLAARS